MNWSGFSNSFSPSTAEEWHRQMMTPASNDNREEGLQYFRIHNFVFHEGVGYSRVGDYSGYHPIKGSVETWHAIMKAWENRYAPFFPEWSGRGDMFVVSTARQAPSWDRKATRDDIIRTNEFSPYRHGATGQEVDWELFRESAQRAIESRNRGPSEVILEVAERHAYYEYHSLPSSERDKKIEEAKEQARQRHIGYCEKEMPRIGDMPTVEAMSIPGTRVQSLAFARNIDATIAHQMSGEVHTVSVMGAKLVVWLETQLLGEELAWRWLGAVYSWKSLSLMALDRCDMQTHTNIGRHVEPLVRRWAHLLREATPPEFSGDAASAPPPFRNNMEV